MKNIDPIFGYTPFTKIAKITGAIVTTIDPAREPTLPNAGIKALYTADTAGCKITSINIKCLAGSSTGLVLLFITDDTDNLCLVKEIAVETYTPSDTVAGFETTEVFEDFQLEPGQTLYAGMLSVGSATNIIAHIADYLKPE
jgi:hypothetical protein